MLNSKELFDNQKTQSFYPEQAYIFLRVLKYTDAMK